MLRGRGGFGPRKCYNCDQTGHLANGCPYPPKCRVCGALHQLDDCPIVQDFIEKRQSGQRPYAAIAVNSVAQQPAQPSAPNRVTAPGVQQQRGSQDTRPQSKATRANALSLIREEDTWIYAVDRDSERKRGERRPRERR